LLRLQQNTEDRAPQLGDQKAQQWRHYCTVKEENIDLAKALPKVDKRTATLYNNPVWRCLTNRWLDIAPALSADEYLKVTVWEIYRTGCIDDVSLNLVSKY
jgi:hypothetical protein